MITKTALLNSGYLLRVKAAVARAIIKAHKPDAVRGIGHAEVYNRNGRQSLEIVARRGGQWEAFDAHDNDVTETLKAALRDYHAAQGSYLDPARIVVEEMSTDVFRQTVEKPMRLALSFQTFGPSSRPMWECRA